MRTATGRPAKCRECSAPITWATTAQGNQMPLDPGPDPTGNVAYYRSQGAIFARVVTKDQPIQEHETPGMPHFATCPPRLRREAAAKAARERLRPPARPVAEQMDLFG